MYTETSRSKMSLLFFVVIQGVDSLIEQAQLRGFLLKSSGNQMMVYVNLSANIPSMCFI